MVDERVWTMESWVGVKSCLSQYSSPPFSFPLFHYWFRVCEKGGQKSNGLGFELGKFILLFFSGRRSRIRSFLFRYIHFLVLVIGAS